jgi:hypothetical protein
MSDMLVLLFKLLLAAVAVAAAETSLPLDNRRDKGRRALVDARDRPRGTLKAATTVPERDKLVAARTKNVVVVMTIMARKNESKDILSQRLLLQVMRYRPG